LGGQEEDVGIIDTDSVEGVVVGTASGPLTLEEIREAAATVWTAFEGPRIRVLWDLRDAQFTLSADDIRALAEFAKKHSPFSQLRMAFVVAGDLEFGLVRMFEVFREAESARTAVFRDRQQALGWLAIDAA
jgi:stage II sporulation SpoAA-like protein